MVDEHNFAEQNSNKGSSFCIWSNFIVGEVGALPYCLLIVIMNFILRPKWNKYRILKDACDIESISLEEANYVILKLICIAYMYLGKLIINRIL